MMKKTITRWAATILMLGSMIPLSAQQTQFVDNGIKYEYLDGNTVKVVENTDNPYEGEIVIPDYVFHTENNSKKLRVTTIGHFAFSECEITSIKLPNTLRTIEYQTFSMCTLKEIVIPYGVTSIGSNAFSSCAQLERAVLPATINDLGRYMLAGCTKLSKLVLLMDRMPVGLDEVMGVFGEPDVLTNLIVYAPENGLETWKKFQPFGYLVSFKDVQLYTPKVDRITYEVISGAQLKMRVGDNTGLQDEAAIPESVNLDGCEFKVTEVKDRAFFDNSSIRKVVLPASIEKLGDKAFGGAYNLYSVVSLAEVPPVCPDDAFYVNTYQHANLYVPAGYAYTYRKAAGWSNFANILEQDTGIDESDANLIQVYAAEGAVAVKGVAEGMLVSVYDVLGSLVTQGFAEGEEMRLDVPQKGVYLVRVGGQCLKVLVK